MKRILVGISLILMVLALASFIGGQAPVDGAPPLSNPLKVALLKWYRANTVPTRFTVGQQPYGLAFDGANIWAANFADNTVSKVQASDGALLGTFPAGGFEPYGVTFDGANIWVSNLDSGNVSELRASDGKLLGTFTVGSYPGWMAFDGVNIWVPYGNNLVAKIRASDGRIVDVCRGELAARSGLRRPEHLGNQHRRRNGNQASGWQRQHSGHVPRGFETDWDRV